MDPTERTKMGLPFALLVRNSHAVGGIQFATYTHCTAKFIHSHCWGDSFFHGPIAYPTFKLNMSYLVLSLYRDLFWSLFLSLVRLCASDSDAYLALLHKIIVRVFCCYFCVGRLRTTYVSYNRSLRCRTMDYSLSPIHVHRFLLLLPLLLLFRTWLLCCKLPAQLSIGMAFLII